MTDPNGAGGELREYAWTAYDEHGRWCKYTFTYLETDKLVGLLPPSKEPRTKRMRQMERERMKGCAVGLFAAACVWLVLGLVAMVAALT